MQDGKQRHRGDEVKCRKEANKEETEKETGSKPQMGEGGSRGSRGREVERIK